MLDSHYLKNLDTYSHNINNNSFLTTLLKPFYDYIMTYVPKYIVPNVITCANLLFLIAGTVSCYKHYDKYPIIYNIVSSIGILLFAIINNINTEYIKSSKVHSPIDELICKECNYVSLIVISCLYCKLFGITDDLIIWKIIVLTSLLSQNFHNLSFDKSLSRIHIDNFILSVALFPIINISFPQYINYFTHMLCGKIEPILFTFFVILLINIHNKINKPKAILYAYFIIYSVFFAKSIKYTSKHISNKFDIFFNTFEMIFFSWEFIIHNMLSKDFGLIEPFIIFINCHNNIIGFILSVSIMVMHILEISTYLNLNVFSENTNVYVCGVFDLCHYGHKLFFKKAMKYGTRLIVGVHNDATVESYKRTPIMTMEERCNEIKGCKYVWKVYPNALLTISKEELNDLNVHVVVCCDEYYNNSNDEWHVIPRNLKILKSVPYWDKMSTTNIIERCKKY